MKRLSVVELKNSLGDVLSLAEYKGERTIVHRRGKDAAAIVSMGDLRLLEFLIERAEDVIDVEAARAALSESKERIPYSEFRRTQGLVDGQASQSGGTRTGAKTL